MEFTSIKQTLIGFTVFLTILALGSCGLANDTAPPGGEAIAFQQDIENATTVPNFATAKSPLTREVLEPLGANAGATLEKRYVTESGAGSRTGRSWADAWAAENLRTRIDTEMRDATANKVYLMMIAGGTYKPTYGNPGNRSDSFSMKNYVAIMGGFDPAGGWDRTGTTIFDGDIGTVDTDSDNSYHVFFHNSLTLDNAHLYGVIITNGNANGAGGGTQNQGGGMYNNGSSPVLTKVQFIVNGTSSEGGGMYNNNSSPVLTKVMFSDNTSPSRGGGMYNGGGSSPVLTNAVFRNNTANFGGGMYNSGASPVLTEVVFSGNVTGSGGGGMYNNGASPVLTEVVFSGNSAHTGGGMRNDGSSPVLTKVMFIVNRASSEGGGMYNSTSSPVMIGAVFRDNIAANGGGMWNNNDNGPGPLIVNTIFSANTLYGSGSGPDIAVNHSGVNPGAETIRIAGSVLGIGLAQPVNAIVGYSSGGGTAALNISNRSLANGAVNFGAEATLTINGMDFTYPTITSGSSAIDIGLYVRKHVNGSTTTYYFSETGTGISWYTGFTIAGGLDGTAVDLPTTGTIEDLTATDIAGNARSGRPDAGVYEVR